MLSPARLLLAVCGPRVKVPPPSRISTVFCVPPLMESTMLPEKVVEPAPASSNAPLEVVLLLPISPCVPVRLPMITPTPAAPAWPPPRMLAVPMVAPLTSNVPRSFKIKVPATGPAVRLVNCTVPCCTAV